MSETTKSQQLGVDLITYYHPEFWSVESFDQLQEQVAEDPRPFWDRVFAEVEAAGIGGIEMTFGPGSWQNALRAYGSADQVAKVAGEHGLRIVSAFFSDFERLGHVPSPEEERVITEHALETARFLRECGGDVLVLGLAMRSSYREDPRPFGLEEAGPLADALNRVGQATRKEGVRIALHSEHSSLFCSARDIDLLLLLTDPEYVGFCPDSAHLVLAGGDPVAIVRHHLDRVLITHWKDATGPYSPDLPIDEKIHDRHDPFFCRVGAGVVDWQAWAALFKGKGFMGCHILEIDSVRDPAHEISEARRVAAEQLG
jgi:sugar phosphate isomerase/epimerase